LIAAPDRSRLIEIQAAEDRRISRARETWSGRIGFILATTGSAVGIGSIWKFPYEVGTNGGTAFVLFYLLGLVLIVVPLMFAEFAIGRRGQGDAATSLANVAAAYGANRGWALAGLLGIVTSFLILSFYSVIGGWTIAYAVETLLQGLPGSDPTTVQERFDDFLGSPVTLTAYHAIFLGITAVIVAGGVSRGIEAAAKILMPILAVLMIVLAVYSIVEGDIAATVSFLFKLDLDDLTASVALEALGLGFFSIGVGLGLMITFASYAQADINLREVAMASVVADTAISLLAGFAVFPIVFAHGLDPASGAGLIFVTLPLAFADMPFGQIAAIAFFALMFVAALASAISILELSVALLLRRLTWSRPSLSLVVAAACFAVGLATVFSFNLWSGWHPLKGIEVFATATIFDILDYLTSNILMPLGGFAIAVFAGWIVPTRAVVAELDLSPIGAMLLSFTLRYVVPLGIATVALAPSFT
jgi:NSS family neurotransmitter:Na+ symporter